MVSEFKDDNDVTIKSLTLSTNLKSIICGTNKGTIRIYPFPLTEELMEYKILDKD